MRRVAITTSTFAVNDSRPLNTIKEAGLEVVLNPYGRALAGDEIVPLLKGCVGVLAGTEPLNEAVLAQLPELKVISRCGIGLDNVDMDFAHQRGIQVFNTPDAPTNAVVELTLALMLDVIRHISWQDRELRSGTWKKRTGALLSCKKIGLIGFGRVGKKLATILTALGCDIAYYDPFTQPERAGATAKSLDDLLAWAEIISLHCPMPANGQPLLAPDKIQLISHGAIVVNTARGKLVDEPAIVAALKSGKLAGAAFDVFQDEPYSGELTQLANTVVTPHIGSAAKETRYTMEMEAALNLLTGLGHPQ